LGRNRDNSIVIKDDLASRLHAKVYFQDGAWHVRDFGLNGTRLNDHKVHGAAKLSDGAVIAIGECRIRFTAVATGTNRTPMLTGGDGVRRMKISVDQPTVAGHGGSGVIPLQPVPKRADLFKATKVSLQQQERTVEQPSMAVPLPEAAADPRKVDELTAFCRFMSEAVAAADAHDVIRQALQAVLNQTTAKLAGYLSLDPSDPTPKLVFPAQATVDVQLSRRLTERVRKNAKMVWLFEDTGENDHHDGPPTDSLSMYTDAVCLPLKTGEQPFAALHVYRTGLCFAEREVKFIEAMAGYLSKALEIHRERRRLQAENTFLRSAAPVAEELIGESTALTTLRQQISRAAPQPFTVLITGESGSGKELVALALHRHSPRAEGPLVVVNCAAIAPTLLEAELFGYRKGAFSGADRDYPGLFEQADEGTLFLDEVGELSLECQAKLLRVIEGKPFRPVGGTTDVRVDVRVIAATHRDLEKEVKANRFRQDLYFRLKVIGLKVPPLRDHIDDVPELARFFLERVSVQCHRSFKLAPQALRKLQAYTWPGNVRQLRAVLESAAVMGETDLIEAEALPIGGDVSTVENEDIPPSLDVEALETWAIRRALRQTNGNVSQSARLLGISRDTLHTKLKKKGIDREEVCQTAGSAED
jgi:Nif-specific regulatory protein